MAQTVVSPDGVKRIKKITHHLRGLADVVGKASPLYVLTATSWIHAIGEAIGRGGRLDADSGLSLAGQTPSGTSFGVIFHPDRDFTVAYINEDDFMVSVCPAHRFAAWPQGRQQPRGRCPGHGDDGDLCFPRVAPIPGTWTIHS